ncbi:MAG: F0F1 ATP synthase subunit gamma, partial [Mesorhizobium sp.]
MASLKDLRNRIASVKATQKITKAMQMVAAAKLRRAQEAAEAARPYSERMGAVLANITQAVGGGGDAPALMTGTGKDDVHLLVVCTAERGLCGGFNSQIARFARDHIRKLLAGGKKVKIICVGKKGFDILRRDYAELIIERVDLREVKTLGFVNADAIAKKVIQLFNEGGFDICTLFYSQFKSVISQVPTTQQIIPAGVSSAAAEATDGGNAVYEYEPEPGEILSDLIPRNISV